MLQVAGSKLQVLLNAICNLQFARTACAHDALCRLCGIIITIRLHILVACCARKQRRRGEASNCATQSPGHVAWLHLRHRQMSITQAATESARHRRRRHPHKLWLGGHG